jgi:DNA-binding MltR family transcriptional regulator
MSNPSLLDDYYFALHEDFDNETDRGVVIVAAAMLDELLRKQLVERLVAIDSSDDDLLDGANAPLGTFSSRTKMAYRVGLISAKFARDLDRIRKIRNDFAHHIRGASFDDGKVKALIQALADSHRSSRKSIPGFDDTPRGRFLDAAAWMIFYLQNRCMVIARIEHASEEFGYAYVMPSAFTDENSKADNADARVKLSGSKAKK